MRILLMGKQRAGKSTAAEYLRQNHGFQVYRLAEPLKQICRDLYGMQGKDRMLLIQVAHVLRSIDPLVFAKAALRRIEADGAVHAVIEDGRLAAEFLFFRQHGFIPVKIDAPDEERKQRPGYVPEAENDPTEREVDVLPIERVLLNPDGGDNLQIGLECIVAGWYAETARDVAERLDEVRVVQNNYNVWAAALEEEQDD